ncbi:MAG: response regulator [Candidatus Rokuibacteriota bacterium]
MAAILIVDDEPSARLTLGLLLRHRGHLVREADSVSVAVSALRADAFDVVVTDLRMPDGLGLEVLQAAKARCPDANVIVLTAHPGWESAKEAMRLGAFDYFEKGQEPDGLFRRIDGALEEQAFRRRIGLSGPVVAIPAAALPSAGARRYLTVLFADMRGSMELLAGPDLEEARQVLDAVIERLMQAVHEAGGTVNQVMGDGIMALFGAPVAHPDHAVRACRAALQMQEAVARYAGARRRRGDVDVQIRVGINSGEVIVRSVGSDLRWDYTAVGPPTHIAARMEQLATPGATVLTAETLALAEGEIRVRPLGRVVVKGLRDELEAYELVGLRSTGAARAAHGDLGNRARSEPRRRTQASPTPATITPATPAT